MDFARTEEHRMMQQMVRDFAQKEVTPIIKEYDRKQEPAPLVLKRMGELGILGICLPVKYGRQGMDYISLGPDRIHRRSQQPRNHARRYPRQVGSSGGFNRMDQFPGRACASYQHDWPGRRRFQSHYVSS